jgi:hypothetical protein
LRVAVLMCTRNSRAIDMRLLVLCVSITEIGSVVHVYPRTAWLSKYWSSVCHFSRLCEWIVESIYTCLSRFTLRYLCEERTLEFFFKIPCILGDKKTNFWQIIRILVQETIRSLSFFIAQNKMSFCEKIALLIMHMYSLN